MFEIIAQKANTNDVKDTLTKVIDSIETRINIEELKSTLEEKASKIELQYYLQKKVSIDDFNQFLANGPRP